MDLGYLKIRNKEVFVSKKFLLDNSFSSKFLDSCLEENCKRGRNHYRFFVDKKTKEFWVNYSSIPTKDLKKHGLPTKTKKLVGILTNAVEKVPGMFNLSLLFIFNIIWYVDYHWIGFVPFYAPYYTDDAPRYKLAKTHAIIRYILDLKRDKRYSVKDIYYTYMQMPNVYYKAGQLSCFYRKLRDFEKNGIPETLMHGFKVNGRSPYKIKPYIASLIETYYSSPKQYSNSMIHKLVNLELVSRGKDKISRGSVVRVIKNLEIQNRSLFSRYGKELMEKEDQPYLKRAQVPKVGMLYEIDGKDLHIKCLKQEEIIRLQMFVVRDVFSGKIVGYDFSDTENWPLVENSLKMAFEKGGIIPDHIVYDKHGVSKSKMYKRLKKRLVDYGVNMRECRANNPQGKGAIENWFKFFGKNYLVLIKGFLGSGIRSRSKGAKVSSSLEKFYLSKNEIQKDKEVIAKVERQIEKYNAEIQIGNTESPNTIFEQAKKTAKRLFMDKDIALLFGKRVMRTVNRRMISLDIEGRDFTYTIRDRLLGNQLNGSTVNVFYDVHDPSRIQIFSLQFEFLGYVTVDLPINQIAKTKGEIENIQNHYLRNICHATENIEDLFDSIEEGALQLELETEEIVDEETIRELEELKKEDLGITIRYLTKQRPYGKAIAKMLERRKHNFLKYKIDEGREIKEIE